MPLAEHRGGAVARGRGHARSVQETRHAHVRFRSSGCRHGPSHRAARRRRDPLQRALPDRAGTELATPYCQDGYLARVAREYGMAVTAPPSATTPTSSARCAGSSDATSACSISAWAPNRTRAARADTAEPAGVACVRPRRRLASAAARRRRSHRARRRGPAGFWRGARGRRNWRPRRSSAFRA